VAWVTETLVYAAGSENSAVTSAVDVCTFRCALVSTPTSHTINLVLVVINDTFLKPTAYGYIKFKILAEN
jgi:hypothetical protein